MISWLKSDIKCAGIGPTDLITHYNAAETAEDKKVLGFAYLVRYGKELPGYRDLFKGGV